MNLTNVQMGVYLSIDVLDQFLKACYAKYFFLGSYEAGDRNLGNLGRKDVTIYLDEPDFKLHEEGSQQPYTRLHLVGSVELRPEGEHYANPLVTMPFDAWIRLTITAFLRDNDIPIIGLSYDGIDGTPEPPQVEQYMDDFFTSDELTAILDSLRIDLFGPLVAGLEPIIYIDEDAPSRENWKTSVVCLPIKDYEFGTGTSDSIGFFISPPSVAIDPSATKPSIPKRCQFAVVYSRTLMDYILAQAAAKKVGTEVEGAEITSLSMTMELNSILVDGHAEKDGADIDFEGPIFLRLKPGTTDMEADTHGISVSVDLPWYLDLLKVIVAVVFFVPIEGWLIDGLWLMPKLSEAAKKAGEAPSLVKGGFAAALDTELGALAEGLKISTDTGELKIKSTPWACDILGGKLELYAEISVREISVETETFDLVNATYDFELNRFTEYELSNGKVYEPGDLVLKMKHGRIAVNGYHDVRMRKGKLLFKLIGEKYMKQLEMALEKNAGKVSADLRKAFDEQGFLLSSDAVVSRLDESIWDITGKKDLIWEIVSGDTRYRIEELAGTNALKVYKGIVPRCFLRANPDKNTDNNLLSLYAVEEGEKN